jgi:hypothetical protein
MKPQLCGMSLITVLWMVGCSPTVRVEAPDKPIEINMNIKIQHEIRVKVEKDIDQMLRQNKELF